MEQPPPPAPQQEEIELNFRLDHNGRTVPSQPQTVEYPTNNVLDYSMQTAPASLRRHCGGSPWNDITPPSQLSSPQLEEWDTSLSCSSAWLDDLLLDCEIADSAMMPRTFWVPANSKLFEPRCSLEQIARDIFRHHTRNLSSWQENDDDDDDELSGAEWWVQIRPSPSGGRYSSLNKDHDDEEEEDLSNQGISFHWDKDEDLRLALGGQGYIHPHISTVTYLTSRGAPTLAVNCRIHPLTGEWILPHLITTQQDTERATAFLSWPAVLKHFSFDGRFLHAAPPILARQSLSSSSYHNNNNKPTEVEERKQQRRDRRVTLLVNIWLHYRPLNVHPFPESMLDKMSGSQNFYINNNVPSSDQNKSPQRVGLTISTTNNQPDHVVIDNHNNNNSTTPAITRHVWPMGDCGSGETIQMDLYSHWSNNNNNNNKHNNSTSVPSGNNNNVVDCQIVWNNDPKNGLQLCKPPLRTKRRCIVRETRSMEPIPSPTSEERK